MHKLLERQLRRHIGEQPIAPEWQRLLDSVDAAYTQADADRLLVERSLELMSQELVGRHERLREEQSVLRSFMDGAPLMMGLIERVDDDIRFVSVNPALAVTMQLTQEELVDRRGGEVGLTPDEIAAWLQLVGEIEHADGPVHISREYPTRSGVRALRASGNRVASLPGRPVRVCLLVEDVTDELRQRQQAKEELERAHKQLVDAAHQAGMAEIAVGVLHNVGNVLNSVNVSATLVSERLRSSKADNLGKMASLVREQLKDPDAWSRDPRARQLPDYLGKLDEHLRAERAQARDELTLLQSRIDHIREIVAMQQSYASASGVTDVVAAQALIESAVQMNQSSIERHGLKLVYELAECPLIVVEKHKVLQILVNLIRNACQSCRASERADKQLTVSLRPLAGAGVSIAVVDNGVGIGAENLRRIFSYGFTTRANGHGFGLHSSALAARELGGALRVHSDGEGRGASFTLELPLQAPSSSVRPALAVSR